MPTIQFIKARRILSILLVFLVTLQIDAQISSNAFYSEQTQYGGGEVEDPIFFYSNIGNAVLNAPSDGNNYDFYWYSYSTASNSFDVLEQTDLNTTISTFSNLTEKGYRVNIMSGATTIGNHYCWNFVPAPAIDSIGIPFESCNNLRLTAYTKNKSLTYYKHHSDNSELFVDYGYEWISSPAGPVSDKDEYSRFIAAPTEDTDYTVTVGEKFSMGIEAVSADKSYAAIAVEAKYTFETEGTAQNEATEGSAPMVVRFTDESLGDVSDWEWTFGDAGKDFVPNPIFTFQQYNEAGYPVVLKVMNLDSGCESETDPEVFTVNEMVVSAPNAFTPFSSPGENDEFRVLYRSVNKFTMLIYNRWGRKVFQTNNPAVGWDGRIGNSRAEPGVYFYKIEATGFKGEKKELDGAVHLIVN